MGNEDAPDRTKKYDGIEGAWKRTGKGSESDMHKNAPDAAISDAGMTKRRKKGNRQK